MHNYLELSLIVFSVADSQVTVNRIAAWMNKWGIAILICLSACGRERDAGKSRVVMSKNTSVCFSAFSVCCGKLLSIAGEKSSWPWKFFKPFVVVRSVCSSHLGRIRSHIYPLLYICAGLTSCVDVLLFYTKWACALALSAANHIKRRYCKGKNWPIVRVHMLFL